MIPSREQLVHELYEAAELEHTLMCTYLYAAFSLKRGDKEALSPTESAAIEGWRRSILRIAAEEMGHLVAVWNITAALGAAPRFGRGNFPLDPGALPAGVVVKLAPFSEAVLQHFVHLERPEGSSETDGAGFVPELSFHRGTTVTRITPMAIDYDTVGSFYAMLGEHFGRLSSTMARVSLSALILRCSYRLTKRSLPAFSRSFAPRRHCKRSIRSSSRVKALAKTRARPIFDAFARSVMNSTH